MTSKKKKLIIGGVVVVYLFAVFATKDYSPEAKADTTSDMSIGAILGAAKSENPFNNDESPFDEASLRASIEEAFAETAPESSPALKPQQRTMPQRDMPQQEITPPPEEEPLTHEEATAIYQEAIRDRIFLNYNQPTETITANGASWRAISMPQKVKFVKAATTLITSANPNASFKIVSNEPGGRSLVDYSPNTGVMFYDSP